MSISISVAMCTFNGGRFLPAQLESIAAQERAPDELVVCDDGSSDSSASLTTSFAHRVQFPVTFVRNEQTLGTSKNFEKAISMCRGPIVVLADQDDIWYRNKLEQIEKTFLSSSAIVAVFSDADLIDEDSRSLGGHLWESFSFDASEQRKFANGQALKVLLKHPVVTGATMAFRKEYFGLLAPFPANHIHDHWISFLLAASGKIEPISEPLMQYRRHRGQQIGPGIVTLRQRFNRARSTGPQFYIEEIEQFHQLCERLEKRRASFPQGEDALRAMKKKISHREHRAQLPRASVARIPRVLREVFNGGYWRYSEGWESIAKDLMIY